MYRKSSKSWFKHIDFICADLLCVQLAFLLAFWIRRAGENPYADPLYRNMAIVIELADVIIIFAFESFKNVLKRGYYIEFTAAVKQAIMLVLFASLYLVSVQQGDNYSRVVLYLTGIIFSVFAWPSRIILKKYLKEKMKVGGDRSLFIITSSGIAEEVVRNIRESNYEMFRINGVIIVDKDLTGKKIAGVPVMPNAENAADILCQKWVDEVFVNVEESIAYPQELISQCMEMGLTLHLNLAKVSNTIGNKQVVEKVGDYTVLTTSINSMNMKQAFMKRALDIVMGLFGCLATGIIFIFIAPAIYISSPGPIFFAQERVGQNGKIFKMYKFRSMYMDAEERKAELMKENKMSNNLMFKMDFDPRIIGNKILPDGTKKTGIGQFIRATSLDEFPQFFNVLLGERGIIETTKKTPLFMRVCAA